MKVLHVYETPPGIYQKYIALFYEMLEKKISLKSLAYKKNSTTHYSIVSHGFLDTFQRFKYKIGISKIKSRDLKIMSNFEILHLQHSYLFSKIIPFLDLEKRPKIVITLRGGDTYIKPWLDKRWLDFYVDYSQKIDSFVVMSHDQKNYLMRWQVPNEKIFVIPISFGSKSTAQPKFPNAHKIMLVSAFRMTWEKNIEGSIQLAKLLKEKNIAFQYDIYGDGNDLGQLYYLVDKYDLQEFVHIKGSVSNDILKEKLLEYDFFLQLSISDAMPASVIEAQSLGLPCIVSESDGIKEGIVHNQTGISSAYCNIDYFANEIISLWNDKARYFQFSTAAIQFANENYSLEVEVKRTVAMYNSLV